MQRIISLIVFTLIVFTAKSQCSGYTLNIAFNNPTCYQFSDGSITASTSGGNGGDYYIITDGSGTIINVGGLNTINNLPAGWYYIEVEDDLGCIVEDSVELINPDQIDADLSIFNPLCGGDSTGYVVVDTVYGAQGNYSNVAYYWNPNPPGINGMGADSIYDLYAGSYTLTINDDLGCSNQFDFEITTPPELYFTEIGSDPAYCRLFGYQNGGGVVYAAAGGGTPDYSYLWTDLQTGQPHTNTTWVPLNPGDYEIQITDANGCILLDTVVVDSINPEATFLVNSAQLNSSLYGNPPIYAEFENTSSGFANPYNPMADTIFFWNLDSPGGGTSGIGMWFVSTNYYEQIDTNYNDIGIYGVTLIAQNDNGCQDTLTRWIYAGMVGLDDEKQIEYTMITGQDDLTIILEQSEKSIGLMIYSINGQLIRREDLNSGTNTVDLNSGAYIVQFIDSKSNEILFNEKIVIGR